MASHSSAVKRNRQRIKQTERNRSAKSALRTVLKRARAAVVATPATSAALVKAATRDRKSVV